MRRPETGSMMLPVLREAEGRQSDGCGAAGRQLLLQRGQLSLTGEGTGGSKQRSRTPRSRGIFSRYVPTRD